MWAVDNNVIEIVTPLIEAGADVNAKNINGKTALMWAASGKSLEIVKLLIEKRAEVSAEIGGQLLIKAARGNSIELAKLLLAKGVNVNTKDEDKKTALMWAVDNNFIELSKFLIENRADVNGKNKNGQTAFVMAKRRGNQQMVDMLKRHGATIPSPISMSAVRNNNIEAVRKAIEQGADVNEKNKNGQTALIIAASKNLLEMAELLIEQGADINIKDNLGFTALMFAEIGASGIYGYRPGRQQMVDLLKKHGAK